MTSSTRITTALAEIKALCEKATPVLHSSIAGDWPEDFSHENGNYTCRCVCCLRLFVGHKRRVYCKQCYDIAASRETIERLVSALEHAVSVCENVDAIHRTESLKAIADKLTG